MIHSRLLNIDASENSLIIKGSCNGLVDNGEITISNSFFRGSAGDNVNSQRNNDIQTFTISTF